MCVMGMHNALIQSVGSSAPAVRDSLEMDSVALVCYVEYIQCNLVMGTIIPKIFSFHSTHIQA